MTLQFTTVERSAKISGVKALVYGGAGVGKTVLAATLPAPVLISAESGLLSLRKQNLERLFGINNAAICYNLPVITVTNVQDLVDAYEWCSKSGEARQFASVGLDSISEIAEVVLANAKKQVKDPRQAYNELSDKMVELVRAFRDLPGKNIYMAAKTEPVKDELTGITRQGPSMPGRKLGPAMPYFFDEVFRLGVNITPQGQTYRFLQTQPDLQYEAKDRSGALALMEAPNLSAVFSKILGV